MLHKIPRGTVTGIWNYRHDLQIGMDGWVLIAMERNIIRVLSVKFLLAWDANGCNRSFEFVIAGFNGRRSAESIAINRQVSSLHQDLWAKTYRSTILCITLPHTIKLNFEGLGANAKCISSSPVRRLSSPGRTFPADPSYLPTTGTDRSWDSSLDRTIQQRKLSCFILWALVGYYGTVNSLYVVDDLIRDDVVRGPARPWHWLLERISLVEAKHKPWGIRREARLLYDVILDFPHRRSHGPVILFPKGQKIE